MSEPTCLLCRWYSEECCHLPEEQDPDGIVSDLIAREHDLMGDEPLDPSIATRCSFFEIAPPAPNPN
jgi:hypothetical protein